MKLTPNQQRLLEEITAAGSDGIRNTELAGRRRSATNLAVRAYYAVRDRYDLNILRSQGLVNETPGFTTVADNGRVTTTTYSILYVKA